MSELTFEDITFSENKENIIGRLYRFFEFTIPKTTFGRHADPKAHNGSLLLNLSQERGERLFQRLLVHYISSLTSTIGRKPAHYIHRASGVPLIGCIYFGLVDRGTNVIEVKPMTGCNLSCMYCSVDEGPKTNACAGYVVEHDYLIEEFKKLASVKKSSHLEAHIAGHSEPTLYPRLAELCKGFSALKNVETIAIDTNGTQLTEEMIDTLCNNGLTRVNLSLNAIDKDVASRIAGIPYPLERVLKMAEIVCKRIKLVIAPTWLPGINDVEMAKIIEFGLTLKKKTGTMPIIGIQNFLHYKYGRNPVKGQNFELFHKKLQALESKYHVNLTDFSKMSFFFEADDTVEKPLKKDEVVMAKYHFPGRRPEEYLYSAKDRVITVFSKKRNPKDGRLRISRTKNNIFIGKIL